MAQYLKPQEGKESVFEPSGKKEAIFTPVPDLSVEQYQGPETKENAPEQETDTQEQIQSSGPAVVAPSDAGSSVVPDDLPTMEGSDEAHRVHLLVNMAMQEGVEKAVGTAIHLFNKGRISSHGLDQFHDTLMDECKGRLKI